jgi:hypothetical protein
MNKIIAKYAMNCSNCLLISFLAYFCQGLLENLNKFVYVSVCAYVCDVR